MGGILSRMQEVKLDFEGTARGTLSGWPALLVMTAALVLGAFIVAVNSFLLIDLMRRSAFFMALVLALGFLLYPAAKTGKGRKPSLLDLGLALASLAVGFYIILTYDDFVARNLQTTRMDIAFGTVAILLVLEAGRRTLGPWLSLLAVAFLLYALYGRYLPMPLGHFGVKPERLVMRMYLVSEGLFGSTLQVAQTFIAMFVILGAFLVSSGITDVLTRIGLAVSGRYIGGPAKVAAVASGLTGMISGTAAANVVTTGTLTIPMMKRVGFPPAFAGAVEAMASTGGLIMPPIMGAAAFLIAEFVGIAYLDIVAAAILPALFFYGSLLLVIHLRAARAGIGGMPDSEIPRLPQVLRRQGFMLLPIVLLVWLLMDGFTPTYSAMLALLAVVVVSWLSPGNRMGPRKILDALMRGAVAAVPVSIACLLAGIIIGVVSLTGLAQVFTSYIEVWSGGILLVALLLTGLAALIMSCALPATAVYIVVAVTVAPALIHMGADPLSAHFFVFWMGVLSNITPPVAIACFAAAGIAGASPGKIAITALRLAFPAFMLAFLFVYRPELLLIDWHPATLLRTVVFCTAGIFAYVVALEGWLTGPLGVAARLGYGAVALLCLAFPDAYTGWVGLAALAAMLFLANLRGIRPQPTL